MVSAAILAQQRRQFLCAREQLEPFVGGGVGGGGPCREKMRDGDAGDSKGRG